VRRHSTRALLQHASTALLAAAVLGDASGAMAFGLEGAQALALLRYSRAHEDEADVEGYRMLVAAGIDPRGLVEFFQSLEREAGGLGSSPYLSTHPTPGDRIARLQALPRPSFVPAPPLNAEQWRALKNICSRAQES
jgi:predicted Zn-dependent protease